MTLYVPSKAELNSCKLYSDSGNIQASDLTASVFGIGCDYGDVTLKNIKSKEQLALNLSAGQLNADTLSGKTVTIYNDSGNILWIPALRMIFISKRTTEISSLITLL